MSPPVVPRQISISLPSFTPDDPGGWQRLLDIAVAADRAGIDRVTVSDHVAFGEHLEAYARPELGGAAGGKQPTGPDGYWLEPLTTLAVIAGMTTRVRLATNILLAALRRPVVLAKTAATIDVLSGGRLDIGVGVGWQREEYEAAGLDFEARGALLDHTIAVCQTLWRDHRASYADEYLSFDAIHQMPKPAQPGGVPVWVSGTVNRRVARRLARFGSGWIPWGPAADELTTSIPAMRALVAAEGGELGPFPVVGWLHPAWANGALDLGKTMAQVRPLAAAGVTDFRCILRLPQGVDESAAYLTRVVTSFRNAARAC